VDGKQIESDLLRVGMLPWRVFFIGHCIRDGNLWKSTEHFT
jgi:hypothetical protein